MKFVLDDKKKFKKMYVCIFLLLQSLFCSNMLFGQNILDYQHNHVRVGDVLRGQYIYGNLQNLVGKKCVWDLSNLEADDKMFQLHFDMHPDSLDIVRGIYKSSLYYLIDEEHNMLYMKGFENNLRKCNFEKPLMMLKYPLAFGDSVEYPFSGNGKYCDKVKQKIQGRVIVKADAEGILILPNGDSLKNVLQVHQTILSRTEDLHECDSTIVNEKPWDMESCDSYQKNDSLLFRKEVWLLYAKGYRYPVIAKKSFRENIKVIFFDPMEQNQLALDEFNTKDKRRQERMQQEKDSKFHYKILHNLEKSMFSLEYELMHKGSVNIMISDARGVVYRNYVQKGIEHEPYHVVFNYGHYPIQGQLIIIITIDDERFVEKVIVNK